jgi:aspartyl-tRNA(Asn)/glutamyl-tRNA(Gln) amidotransferase subunit A
VIFVPSDELAQLSIRSLHHLIVQREVSPVEVTKACLERLSRSPLNTVIRLLPERALRAAVAAERSMALRHDAGPLHGVPFGVKDSFDVAGVATTAGCRALQSKVRRTATCVRGLERGGAILVAKLNMQPLAYGATGDNDDFGAVKNPWDPSTMSGGSSSGPAAAVGGREVPLAIGSDTGGSVRIPSSLCGVVGLKPTYGRISRRGMLPLAPSMDHVGPITRTVDDADIAWQALRLGNASGYDTTPIGDLKMLVAEPSEADPLDPEVASAFSIAVGVLSALGIRVSTRKIAMLSAVQPVSTCILMSEAAYSQRSILTPDLDIPVSERRRVQAGLFIPAFRYLAAQKQRKAITASFRRLLEDFHLYATPATPIPAPPLGTTAVAYHDATYAVGQVLTHYTRLHNLTGFPAISIPCGFTREGLPIGMQLATRPGGEPILIAVGRAYQASSDWHTASPRAGY